jgi:VWFA-related protein
LRSIQTAALVCLLAARLLSAQAPQQSEPQDAVFSSDTRLVSLNVTVVDKGGHLVTTLNKSAFTVLESGAPQQIKLFKHEDVPVSMGLIIDNSGSMREKRQAVESSALALVRDSNPDDEAFVVNFNDEAYLDADFTSDIKALEQGLAKIDSKGGTAMRDAIMMSVEHLQKKAKRDKKVILVVTDGNDNASSIQLPELIRAAQQNDVLIYAIGLLGEEDRKEAAKAKRALNLLVESTGGMVFYPKDVTEVEKIAHEVARDIRNQYTITYTPSNQALDGSFRPIKVTIKAPGNPAARTRLGYYATKDRGTKLEPRQ